jgi:hypothetical protein
MQSPDALERGLRNPWTAQNTALLTAQVPRRPKSRRFIKAEHWFEFERRNVGERYSHASELGGSVALEVRLVMVPAGIIVRRGVRHHGIIESHMSFKGDRDVLGTIHALVSGVETGRLNRRLAKVKSSDSRKLRSGAKNQDQSRSIRHRVYRKTYGRDHCGGLSRDTIQAANRRW